VVSMRVDYHRWRRFVTPLLLVTAGLMAAVMVPGLGVNVNGSSRWLGYGQLRIQPSELAKLAVILFAADLLARRADKVHDWRVTLRPVMVVFGLFAVLLMAQPNLGTTIILAAIVLAVLFVAGVEGKPLAVVGDRLCTDLLDVTSDLSALDSEGFWAVVIPYDGAPVCARFGTVRPARPWRGARWHGPSPSSWSSSLDEKGFGLGVEEIRGAIAAGDVYQVNLTRVLSAPVEDLDDPHHDIAALGAALALGNPAPFSAVVRVPSAGVAIASASPERYLRRDGRRVASSPIKGTAATPDGFTSKDHAENIMIVDLVRNDLGRVCEYGSVSVPSLLAVEAHPGLYHLVSTVWGELRHDIGWPELIDATFPLADAASAHRRMESSGHIGKLVLSVDPKA